MINNSDEPKEIAVGEAFVTVMFHYLKKNSLRTTDRGQNMANRLDVIAQTACDLSDFVRYTRKNAYLASKEDLKRIMQDDKHFLKWKEYFKNEDKKLQKVIRIIKALSHIFVATVIGSIAFGFVKFVLHYLDNKYSVDTSKLRMEIFVLIFTWLCYALRAFYSNIYKKWFDKSLEKRVSEEVERPPVSAKTSLLPLTEKIRVAHH